jgi:hypothetical protein
VIKDLIIVDGGIGDSCSLTSVVSNLPKSTSILTYWPYLFYNNPKLICIYDYKCYGSLLDQKKFFSCFDNLHYFYPYADKEFLTTDKHLIEYGNSYFQLSNNNIENEYYINENDYNSISDFIQKDFVLFQWTSDTHNPRRGVYKSLNRYNAQEIVNYLINKNYTVIEVESRSEEPLLNTTVVQSFCYKEYLLLTMKCKFFVGIDSCIQHFSSNKFCKKKGLVLWGSTNYKKYGYEHNINVESDLPDSMFFSSEKIFGNIDSLINAT